MASATGVLDLSKTALIFIIRHNLDTYCHRKKRLKLIGRIGSDPVALHAEGGRKYPRRRREHNAIR